MPTPESIPSHILATTHMSEAQALMGGDRNDSYGDAWDNFGHIADLWSAYLGIPIKRSDVAAMNALQKIARSKMSFKLDNGIDNIAYTSYWSVFCELESLNAAEPPTSD